MPKPPKPPPLLPHILYDTREQIPLKFSSAVTSERVTLTCGDYTVRGASERVAIERKGQGEIQSCCGIDRERFIAQLERMTAYPCRHLVIEGSFTEASLGISRSNINPLSVIGTLIKASELGIAVWFCDDAAGAALMVERILTREHNRVLFNEKQAAKAAKESA